jgi:hypothetical protein
MIREQRVKFVSKSSRRRQIAEALPVFDDYTTLTGAFVGLYDSEAMALGIFLIRIL